MPTGTISNEFAEQATVQLDVLQKIDEVLQPTAAERRQSMDTVLQNLIRMQEANEITDAELQYATNLWLDYYSLD